MGKFLHCDWLGVGQFIVIFQIFSVLWQMSDHKKTRTIKDWHNSRYLKILSIILMFTFYFDLWVFFYVLGPVLMYQAIF